MALVFRSIGVMVGWERSGSFGDWVGGSHWEVRERALPGRPSIVDQRKGAHGSPDWRTTRRKPMWLADVSIAPCLVARQQLDHGIRQAEFDEIEAEALS